MTEPQALVLAGHGSHRNPRSARPVLAHADRIRERGRFDEVRAAFWKEPPELRDVLSTLESEAVFVVPAMMSEGYFVDEVFPRELGVEGSGPPDGRTRVHYTPPVGTHPSVADVIVRRAESVTGDPAVGPGTGLAIVGHGTERNEHSAASTYAHADRLRGRDRFDEVRALFMDQEPSVRDLTRHFGTDDVVVVPLFVADGEHTTVDIPAEIGIPEATGDGGSAPAAVGGRRIWYAGAVGTEPLLADVAVERAVEAGATIDRPTPEGAEPLLPGAAGRAFLRWVNEARRVEAAGPGGRATRTWGELAVSAAKDDAERCRYAVRHRDDRGADASALERYETPEAVRDRVRLDDGGRYRPLRGAPTLPTGWVATDLDGAELVRTVDHVYPASVVDWDRERRGELDVTHFREAADRQTGLYATVADASGDDLRCTVAACCARCEKRRAWDEDDETTIPVNGETGSVPCREPCSFLIAAAREFVALDGTTDPDPSVARDGPVRPGAFERPGNVYRERFLRAKRGTLAERATSGGDDS